jgi:hypothetical protein
VSAGNWGFGAVENRDVFARAYRDVFTASPKALLPAGAASGKNLTRELGHLKRAHQAATTRANPAIS